MDSYKFMIACKNMIIDYFTKHKDTTDKEIQMKIEDVFVVWTCKALQNNKTLLSTKMPDGLYYEITYNGDKHEAYVDVYKKWENFVVKEEDFKTEVKE